MMRTRVLIHRAAWLAMLLLGACSSAPSATGQLSEASMVENGRMLNGRMLNGRMLNGRMLNGSILDGLVVNSPLLEALAEQLASVDRAGGKLGGSRLATIDVGGGLTSAADGATLSGADLIGASLVGHTSWGRTVALRIDDAYADAAPNDDLMLYQVSVAYGRGWLPLCGVDDNGDRIPTVAVAGRWDLRQGVSSGGDHVADPAVFTFACAEDAVGKCARLGYKPWKPELAAHHQACTRMVRADYCGDGRSHTVDGTWINVYDGLGIQADTENWYFEAEWDAAGARCVTHQRVVDSTTVPECGRRLVSSSCGALSHFASGTLLMDEYKVAPAGGGNSWGNGGGR
jgi:hypothetical protein